MRNNITREDLDAVTRFLSEGEPILTQSKQVELFEQEWSRWLGVRHSVFVNSGSSANLITMAALRHRYGPGEVIVPALTWVSDITSVLHCGITPVFVDIDPRTLGMDTEQVIDAPQPPDPRRIPRPTCSATTRCRTVCSTRCASERSRSSRMCASPTARPSGGRKLGTFGLASNFSFYYAHHMSTIEGGMVSTDDPELHAVCACSARTGWCGNRARRRSKQHYAKAHPDLTPDFIFALSRIQRAQHRDQRRDRPLPAPSARRQQRPAPGEPAGAS